MVADGATVRSGLEKGDKLMAWGSEAEARAEIKKLVEEYYHTYKEEKNIFEPGDRINYSGRVFDEKDMKEE